MADFMLLGLFENVEVTADVLDDVRGEGVKDDHITIMSHVPYAPKLFGREAPRLWYLPFVLGGAATGVLIAAFITFGTPALYPINVGGQALTPVPPSAIIFFEFICLFTMIGVFIGFLVQNRFPILVRQMYDERITDGYIGVQVRAPGATAEKVAAIFEAHHAKVIQREDAAAFKSQGIRHLLFWGAVSTGGLVAMAIPLLFSYDIVKIPWVNTMDDTVAVAAQEGPRRAAPAASIPIQGPVLIAGQPATLPLPATDTSIERGKTLYEINCAMCHGAQGDLQGAEVGKYFPEIPALVSDRVKNLSDAQIFVVITNGKNRMPSLAENVNPGETWDIINYIRSLGG